MIDRIENKFKNLKAKNQKAVVTFNMAFDPDKETSLKILQKLPEFGADILEFGMAFSDPMADGPIIEEAGMRALKSGSKLSQILELISKFRENNHETPIILMGYFNPINNYGIAKFCKEAANVGVDGLIIVDLPIEEDEQLAIECEVYNLALIKLITPTTSDDRIKKIVSKATGFIYYVAVAGITGTKSGNLGEIEKSVKNIRKYTKLPIAVGFGIKDKESVTNISKFSDAVVVGSALVDKIAKFGNGKQVFDFVRNLRD